MPNGQVLEFVGKNWYGTCTTAAATAAKTVSILGFTSADLVAGVRVTVLFSYANTVSAPSLNVTSTGAKTIARRASSASLTESAGQYEWQANSIITFVYSGYVWVIDDGNVATTTYYGKTKLSNGIGSSQTTALTPYAVYSAGYITSASLPTKVSDLTNDSGYLTLATLPIWDGSVT